MSDTIITSLSTFHDFEEVKIFDMLSVVANRVWLNILAARLSKEINQYKLGHSTTQHFLEILASHFESVNENEKLPLELNHDTQICIELLGLEHLTPMQKYLIQAWNAPIAISKAQCVYFNAILKDAKDNNKPTYFAVNGNELNVVLILKKLGLDDTVIQKVLNSADTTSKAIEIAPNAFLCLSYRYHTFQMMQTIVRDIPQKDRNSINVILPNKNNVVSYVSSMFCCVPTIQSQLQKLGVGKIIDPKEYREMIIENEKSQAIETKKMR